MSVKTQAKTQKVTYAKVNSVEEVLQNQNTKYTYAVVRGRNNTIVRLLNRNGKIYVSVGTIVNTSDGRVLMINRFNAFKLRRVIEALNDLLNELESKGVITQKQTSKKVY